MKTNAGRVPSSERRVSNHLPQSCVHARRNTQHACSVPSHQSPVTDYPSSFTISRSGTAFTLLEVMIACGIFFIAIFAILGLVSNCLRNARALRHIEVDAGMVAAQLYKTNKLSEGVLSGDFGDTYRDYTWETETQEAATNGLYQVDIVVRKRGLQNPVDTMSVWIYSPESSTGPFNRSPFSNPRR